LVSDTFVSLMRWHLTDVKILFLCEPFGHLSFKCPSCERTPVM
jgi:hypothetical protein